MNKCGPMNDFDAVVAFTQSMRDTQATEDEVQLFCSCAAQVFRESRKNPGREVKDLLEDFRCSLAQQAPATGYRDLSGQTVELPVYRLTDTGLEHIGMQPFTFPEADRATVI